MRTVSLLLCLLLRPTPKRKKASSSALRWNGSTLDWELGGLIFQVPFSSAWSVVWSRVHMTRLLSRPATSPEEAWMTRLDDFQDPLPTMSTQRFNRMPWAPRTGIHRAGDYPWACAQIEDLAEHRPLVFFSTWPHPNRQSSATVRLPIR